MSSPSSSTTPPSIIVTLDDLRLALDKMGLTKSVSAVELYHSILQLQASVPSTPSPSASARRKEAILQTAKDPPNDHDFCTQPRISKSTIIEPGSEYFSPARRERRRKLLELAKAAFPDGVPSRYPKPYIHDPDSL
jgi:hypothetical protein